MTLTGTVTGSSREALIKQAEQEARTYYDNDCVTIRPLAEHSDGNGKYTLDWAANPNLHFTGTAAPTCNQCGKELS